MGAIVLTSGFTRAHDGVLRCEDVSLSDVAAAVGTPAYVYSAATIRDRYERLDAMLAPVPHRIHYTLKANSTRAVLDTLRALGAGVDVVSGGELFRARRAGFAPDQIIFGGVGKTREELAEGLEGGVLFFNLESEAEARILDGLARERGVVAPVSLRVNPEVTVDAAHQYIRTGERGNKFGIPFDEVLHVGDVVRALPNLRLVGLDMHLGSQLSRIDPYRIGTERLVEICDTLRRRGVDTLQYLDIGGGLGVRYDTEEPPDLDRFAQLVLPLVAATGLTLVMEPGRFVVGNSGVLLTRVLYRKRSGSKEYVVTDAGMTELLRPSHYAAFHRVEPVVRRAPDDAIRVDVVGPVCESGDFLALDRELEPVQPGDLLAVFDVGAYGSVMASNYNSRRRAVEVMVDGARWAAVTARERYEDLVRHELPEPEWRG